MREPGAPLRVLLIEVPVSRLLGEDRLLATKARRRHNSLVQTG